MKLKFVLILCLVSFMMSCKASKTNATPEQIAALDKLVESKSFVIKSEWALPFVTNSMIAVQNAGLRTPGNSANRISLLEIPNNLKLTGNSISSQLPFYGEVQMPSGYMNTDQNDIVFDGNINDFEIDQNKNSSYTLRFGAKSHNEYYNVVITLFPNMRSEMILRGAKRDPIRYTGMVQPVIE